MADDSGWALELYFEPTLEARVRGLWERLEARGIPTPARSGFLPHLSLGLYAEIDEGPTRAALDRLAADVRGFALQLDAFCVFGNAVLSWAPVATEGLLGLHGRVHREATGLGAPDPLYAPGRWVPHVTLTERIPTAEVCRALEVVLPAERPVTGRVDRLGLCRFRPRMQDGTVSLGYVAGLLPPECPVTLPLG
jgi:2'-5' RNA ligase